MDLEAISPFHDRPEELALYSPLAGTTMLELGNKKNGGRTYKAFFEAMGYHHVSVDWNGQDGALKRDLRLPLGLGTFDMVTNIGTSEHVSDQLGVWRNIVEACHERSVLICTTPYPGDWTWHGDWYPQSEFYSQLAERNGFEIVRFYVAFDEPRRMWFVRMIRTEVKHFEPPDFRLMYRNHR